MSLTSSTGSLLASQALIRPLVSWTGTAGNDDLTGIPTSGADSINGAGGNDTLYGWTGNDTLAGGNGDDVAYTYLTEGHDRLDGGAGTDTLYLYGGFNPGGIVFSIADNLLAAQTLSDGTTILNFELALIEGSDNAADSLTGGTFGDVFYGFGGNDTLDGAGGSDTLYGGNDNDWLGTTYGDADALDGGFGIDVVILDWRASASGLQLALADTLFGVVTLDDGTQLLNIEAGLLIGSEAAADTLSGGAYNDAIGGIGGQDQLYGLGGNDTLDGGDDYDWLYGGDGNDEIYTDYGGGYASGDAGADAIFGGPDADWLLGWTGADSLSGGEGDDYLDGQANADRVAGGTGNDWIVSADGEGPDTLDGGSGSDTLELSRAGSATGISFSLAANLSGTVQLADGTRITNFEAVAIYGSNTAADTLTGGELGDSFYGNGGNDSLAGGGGADLIDGGGGADTIDGGTGGGQLYGGNGNDSVSGGRDAELLDGGAGTDTLAGSDGDDQFDGGAGSDSLAGGAGFDYFASNDGEGPDSIDGGADLDYLLLNRSASASGIALALADNLGGWTTLVDGTRIRNIEAVTVFGSLTAADTLTGGVYNDVLQGNGGADLLDGGGGNDFLDGGNGGDSVNGGSGDDWLASNGRDTLDGGSGSDTLELYRFDSASAVIFTVAANLLGTVTLADNTAIRNVERLVATGSNTAADDIAGGALNDILAGAGGNDTLAGGGGDDQLAGGTGNDSLAGGDGNDRVSVYSNEGADTIDGGDGSDFLFLDRSGEAAGISFSVAANLAGSAQIAGGTVIRNIERVAIIGSDTGGDSLRGGAAGDVLFGLGGNDTLGGGGDTDLLFGGNGNDDLEGGDGADFLDGNAGSDTLDGGDDDDFLQSLDGEGGDSIDGGNGDDLLLIDRYGSTQGMVFSIAANLAGVVQLAGGTSVRGIERVEFHGSNTAADTLSGGDAGDALSGNGGNDSLAGAGGADELDGGAGNDRLAGGDGDDRLWSFDAEGPDTLDGGNGIDFLYLDRASLANGVSLSLIANLTAAQDIAGGSRVSNIERGWLFGSDGGADSLTGGSLDDVIGGAAGDDSLAGRGGSDALDGGIGLDTLDGGDGDDLLSSADGEGADSINGGAGNDTLTINRYSSETGIAFAVADNLLAAQQLGDGTRILGIERVTFFGSSTAADTLTGGTLSDELFGIGGADSLRGAGGDDQLFGGAGNDTLGGGDGFDYLYGGDDDDSLDAGNDGGYLTGDDGNDTLTGGTGIESLAGGAGNDRLVAGAGGDVLDGWSGSDSLSGGAGNDTFWSRDGEGPDTIDGGADSDYLLLDRYSAAGGIAFSIAANLAGTVTLGDGSSIRNIERVEVGGSNTGNDTLTGGALADALAGNGGNDTLDGAGGDDVLAGGNGADTLVGGGGRDSLAGMRGSDSIDGGGDDDALYSLDTEGPDTLDGGSGSDYLFLDRSSSTAGIAFTLATNLTGSVTLADGTVVRNIERVGLLGSGTAADTLVGGALDDALTGQGGNDSLAGNEGRDTLDGGAGNDSLAAGNGDDSVLIAWGGGNDTIDGGAGTDTLQVDASGSNSGASITFGASGSWNGASWSAMETLRFAGSNSGGDSVLGGSAADTLAGGGSEDSLGGRAGADLLDGGEGEDTLTGGGGNDTLDGSGGSDVVVFSGNAADYRLGESLGYLTVTDANLADGDDGTDYLTNVEYLQFADRRLEIKPGVEFRLNDAVQDSQTAPAIAALTGGGFVAVWLSDKADGSGLALYARRFDADGVAIDDEVRINDGTLADGQGMPAVTALADGGYVVSWVGSDGNGSGILAKRFDSLGAALGNEVVINATVAGEQSAPALAGLADGGFVAVWTSTAEGAPGVYLQRYGADGNPVGTETKFDDRVASQASAVDVRGTADGGYIVTWTDSAGGGTGDSEVYARRAFDFGDGTGFTTGVIRVTATATGPQGNSAAAALADGGFVLVWESADGDGSGIRGQRFDFLGARVGAEFQVNSTTAGAQSGAAIESLADGGFVVTWQSADGAGSGVFAQRFDASGAATGDEFRVNTTTAGEQGAAVVTQTVAGEITIVWQSATPESGNEGSGIFAKRYGEDGRVRLIEIWGTEGDDYLDLRGLGGDVRVNGRGGNDTFLVDSSSDEAQDIPNGQSGGTADTVIAERNYSLWDYVENLTLAAGQGDLSGTGNAGNNALTGNEGNNTLNGGAGNDQMTGGDGNDTYYVDSAGDTVVEEANSPNGLEDPDAIGDNIDTVIAQISFTLSANVENLTLAATADLSGSGNELDNLLLGNAGNNSMGGFAGNDTLDGSDGNDTLAGGAGNDTYRIDGGDTVTEAAGEGTDSVESAATLTLGANIENLTITGSAAANGTGNSSRNALTGNGAANSLNGASGNDTLTGGSGNDTLIGGSGNDRLLGNDNADQLRGGPGNDTLVGGNGADAFIFDAATGATNVDAINDFQPGTDRIRLDDDVFTALGPVTANTALAANAFALGTAATTSSQRIIYDQASGALYYDADGVGGAAQVQIATLGAGTHPTLQASDFLIIS